MIVYAMHPGTYPDPIKPCFRITGSPDDPGTIQAIADAIRQRRPLFLHSAMAQFNAYYDQANAPQVIDRAGQPPRPLFDQVAAGYARTASLVRQELEKTPDQPAQTLFCVSNPENGPGLHDGYVFEMKRILSNLEYRRSVQWNIGELPPDAVEQWSDAHTRARRLFHEQTVAAHDIAWTAISQPMAAMASTHYISTGGMSGGHSERISWDYNGWANIPRTVMHHREAGAMQFYFTVGGAETRLKTGLDPRWLQFLLQIDTLKACPRAAQILCSVRYANLHGGAQGITTWHTARQMAYANIMKRRTIWWNPDPAEDGQDIAEAAHMAARLAKPVSGISADPIPFADTLTIGGLTTTQSEYLANMKA